MDFSLGMSGRQELLNRRERCFAEEINDHTRLSSCSNGVLKLLRSLVVLELFYSVLHPYYPLRFWTTNRRQSPVFLAKIVIHGEEEKGTTFTLQV